MNPYDILGVTPDTDDETVRNAYLEAIRHCPPERDPERFATLNEAYQTLKDEESRRRYDLFSRKCPERSPWEVVVAHFHWAGRPNTLDMASLKDFLRKCASS